MLEVESLRRYLLISALLLCCHCGREAAQPQPAAASGIERPSILLVTLDTTRADSIGPGALGVSTPAFNSLAARGRTFSAAYATAPQTLPSHASMMTGLYPGGHGVHENGRYLSADQTLVAERLRSAGYRTAAFVSSFTLAGQFGLSQGFDRYDDGLPEGKSERSSQETTDQALAYLSERTAAPLFLWVHYFDPHHPYEPPAAFATNTSDPYRGEVAAMDAQLGRLLKAFEERVPGPKAIIALADHGESLGEHGEAQHGNLLYQPVMHVPMVIAGPAVSPSQHDGAVSTRRVFHTILDFAGVSSEHSLRSTLQEVVLGEGMMPFLQFGWQPQVMAVEGSIKAILAGEVEAFDLSRDRQESNNLGSDVLSRTMRAALRDYPIPSPSLTPRTLSEEDQRKLASLGYISTGVQPVIRSGAPRPAAMSSLFDDLDKASGYFVAERYSEAVPHLRRILEHDPFNLMAALRLAVAYSALGRSEDATRAFRRAEQIAPQSQDVQHYLALHLARGDAWRRAVPMLERVVAASPERITAWEALALLREREGRLEEALSIRQRVLQAKNGSAPEWARAGLLAMQLGKTATALEALGRAQSIDPAGFGHHLELGVLLMASNRLAEARDALDRVPPTHPGYAMALFKRAQVSVLLGEPDREDRIALARRRANAQTRVLVEREGLFRK